MHGDDMIRITVQVGRRRESPLGGEFKVRATRKFYVPFTFEDVEIGGAQGECGRKVHEALKELLNK